MPSRLREPFGKAGLIVAIVALVASLAGGAIAADLATDSGKRNSKRAKNNKKKKQKGVTVAQVRRISKQEARKFANSNPGAPGLIGPQGVPGPQGPKGDTGSAGSAGAAGKSVEVSSEAAGINCEEGGIKVQAEGSATKKYVCNGKEGEKGDPWTLGGTLPPGETETGAWSFGPTFEGQGAANVSISFPIQLASPLGASNVHYIDKTGQEVTLNFSTFEFEKSTPTKCLGSASAPSAEPGHLCVYATQTTSAEVNTASNVIYPPGFDELFSFTGAGSGAGLSGARLYFFLAGSNQSAWGSWAVTA